MLCFGLQSIALHQHERVQLQHTSWRLKSNFPERFKSHPEKSKNVIRPRSVRIWTNCALGLSTALGPRPRVLAVLKTLGRLCPNTDLPAEKITYMYYILQSNLTDLQVAKTNWGRPVSQVLKYYRCQKREINKVTECIGDINVWVI